MTLTNIVHLVIFVYTGVLKHPFVPVLGQKDRVKVALEIPPGNLYITNKLFFQSFCIDSKDYQTMSD
jgi:hypothetical protein